MTTPPTRPSAPKPPMVTRKETTTAKRGSDGAVEHSHVVAHAAPVDNMGTVKALMAIRSKHPRPLSGAPIQDNPTSMPGWGR